METTKKQITVGASAFLLKVMQDKKDIKTAIKNKQSLSELAIEKGIKFAKPL